MLCLQSVPVSGFLITELFQLHSTERNNSSNDIDNSEMRLFHVICSLLSMAGALADIQSRRADFPVPLWNWPMPRQATGPCACPLTRLNLSSHQQSAVAGGMLSCCIPTRWVTDKMPPLCLLSSGAAWRWWIPSLCQSSWKHLILIWLLGPWSRPQRIGYLWRLMTSLCESEFCPVFLVQLYSSSVWELLSHMTSKLFGGQKRSSVLKKQTNNLMYYYFRI